MSNVVHVRRFAGVSCPHIVGRRSGSFPTWPGRSSPSSAPRRSCGCCRAGRRLGVVQLAGELGLPKAHRARHPAHAGPRRVRRAGSGLGQVPARRRAAAHGQQLPRRQRAAHPRAELVGLARGAQRRERPHRHAARGSGARRPPRVPSGRQPPGARGRERSAAGARVARWARCCWPPTATRRPSSSGAGLGRFTAATITDPAALAVELDVVHERGWAADAEELVTGEASLAAPIEDRRGVTVGAIGDLRPGRAPAPGRRSAHGPRLVRARGGVARSRATSAPCRGERRDSGRNGR